PLPISPLFPYTTLFRSRARDGELEHPRHRALAEDRIAEDLVVHVAPLRDEAGVLDVAHDLDLVHAVARAGRADDVLLDHHAAHRSEEHTSELQSPDHLV